MTTSHTVRNVRRKYTAKELADRTGMSERTVRRLIAEERTDYEDRARQRREQIIALHQQGLTQAAIARQLGISRPLVSRRISDARRDGIDLTLNGLSEAGSLSQTG